jgi:glycosyltransferase domain-containing protein
MMQFSKLTLVVATYGDRHDFVLRTCKFWSNTDVRIIIVDGSANQMSGQYQNLLNKNTLYQHFPLVDYYTRLRKAMALVETEYVIMHPDDDIMFQSVMAKCIESMDNDPELLACDAVYSWFTFFKNNLYSLKEIAVVEPFKPPGNDRALRLQDAFNSVFLYGIWRTKILRTCFKMFPDKISSPSIFCMTFQWGLAYLGKWKTLPELMWMRSYEVEPASERDGIRRNFYFHQWYENESYRSEVEEMLERMVSTLVAETKDDANEIRENLIKVFEHNSNLSKNEFGVQAVNVEALGWRRRLKNFLPRSIIKTYRRYRYKNIPPAGVSFDEQIGWLKENNIKVDDGNIKWLKESLSSYYTSKNQYFNLRETETKR